MSLNIRKTINATFTALLDFVEPLNSDQTAITNTVYYIAYVGNDNKKHYCPGLKSDSSTLVYNGKTYSYNSGLKTIFFRAPGNTTYRLPNAYTSNYDIPAGTYGPSTFDAMIQSFISYNGNRSVANSFSVKVNNQTVSVNAGQKIYYTVSSSSPQGYMRTVYFNPSYTITSGLVPEAAWNNSSSGFTKGHAYVVYNTGSSYWFPGTQFQNWANYSITVNTGINFT